MVYVCGQKKDCLQKKHPKRVAYRPIQQILSCALSRGQTRGHAAHKALRSADGLLLRLFSQKTITLRVPLLFLRDFEGMLRAEQTLVR